MHGLQLSQYKTLIETMPVAVILIRARDGQILHVNEIALAALKFKRSEILGEPAPSFLANPSDIEEFINNFKGQSLLEDHTTTFRRGDDSHLSVNFSASRLVLNDETVLMSVFKDMTPVVERQRELRKQSDSLRRQAQENLAARDISETKFDALVNRSLQGILVHRRGRALFANQTFADLVGYTVDEILAMDNIFQMTTPEERQRLANIGTTPLRDTSAAHHFKIQAVKKDGTRFWISNRSEIVDWDGVDAILATIVDITSEVQATRELERVNAELEQRVEERTEELRLSEARLGTAVKLAKFGYGAFSTVANEYTHCSTEHASFYGLKPADFIGHPSMMLGAKALTHPEDKPLVEAAKADLTRGVQTDIEHRVIGIDGNVRWIRQTCIPIRNNEGDIVEERFFSHDITERKHLEEQVRDTNVSLETLVETRTRELAASEIKFRSLAMSSQFGLAVVRNDKFLYANDAWAEILGYTLDEILSHESAITILDAEDRNKVVSLSAKRAKGRTAPDRYELRARRKNGDLVWLDNAEQRIDWDGQPALLISILDITDKMLAQEATESLNRELEKRVQERTHDLRVSEDRLQQAIELAGLGFGTWSYAEDNYLHLSPEYKALLDVAKEQAAGNANLLTNSIHEDDREFFLREIERVRNAEKLDIQFRVEGASGNVRWLRQICVPIHDEGGAVTEARFVAQDVTEHKLLEEQLLGSNKVLETQVRTRTQELTESERKFRAMAETSHVGLAVIRENKFLYTNQAWADMFGYNIHEMLNFRSAIDLIDPRDQAIVRELEDIRADGENLDARFEFRGIRKDGKPIWLDNIQGPVEWDGKSAKLISVVDITERKNAERALVESESLIASLLENAPFGFAIKNREGDYLLLNTGRLDVFHKISKAGEVKPLGEILGPEVAARLEEADREVYATGQSIGVDDEFLLDLGDVALRIIKFPIRAEDGAVHRIGTIVIDATTETQARRELEANERATREIFESSLIGAAVYDNASRNVIFANSQLLEILDITLEEFKSRPPNWIWADASVRRHIIAEMHEKGSAQDFVELRKADGTPIWCMFACRFAQDSKDKVMFWVHDLTDLHDTQIALIEAKDQAEHADRAKTDFLSAMSHELRTPLNAVLGFAQLLEEGSGTQLDEDQAMAVRMIMSSGQLLLSLIKEVLDLTRIQDGTFNLENAPIDVEAMVGDCVDLIAPLIEERGLSLEFNAGDFKNLEILGDSMRLKQVLLNLLQNAVKYNRDAGRIALQPRFPSQNTVRIVVSDTGAGIAEKDMANIFNPFERLDAVNGPIEGTGIGLTIARRLVEAMDGTIGVESEVGSGSDFWIELPRNQVLAADPSDADSTQKIA